MTDHAIIQAIQTELSGKCPKQKYNKFGKFYYRSLEQIIEALQPILVKHEVTLVLSDEITTVGGVNYMTSRASLYSIKDGHCLITNTFMAKEAVNQPGMSEPQMSGSAASYARKYCLGGLLLLDDADDADAESGAVSKDEAIKAINAVGSREEFEATFRKYIQFKDDADFKSAAMVKAQFYPKAK